MESVNLGWRNPLVFGSLILGVACLIALVVVEGNVTSPMLPLALFESRSSTGTNVLTLFLYAAIAAVGAFLPGHPGHGDCLRRGAGIYAAPLRSASTQIPHSSSSHSGT